MAGIDRLRQVRRDIMAGAVERWRRRAGQRRQNEEQIAAKGAGAADSQGRKARLAARETVFVQAAALRQRGALPLGIERKMGATLDFVDTTVSEAGRTAGRPVARIVTLGGPGIEPEGYATGFLIAPRLLITNQHVLPAALDAGESGANFLYERTERGVQQGVTFALDPATFYLADPVLDYAIVAVQQQPLGAPAADPLGQLFLIEATPKILVGEPVHIIQYPEGRTKAFALTNDRLLDIVDEQFLHYETDTLGGSSGSPAFSKNWELVALHHASIPRMRGNDVLARDGSVWNEAMGDEEVDWVANEGIRISAIVKSLAGKRMDDPGKQALLDALLASTSDPVDDLMSATARMPGAAETAAREAAAAPLGRTDMTTPSMLFTGPVTINIVCTPAAAALPETVPKAVPPAAAEEEKALRFDQAYARREGYSPGFLDKALPVPTPKVAAARQAEMLTDAHGKTLVLRYHHFELAMNRHRRLMMWSAANVDYDPAKKPDGDRAAFGTDRWVPDPRIPGELQLQDADFYKPAGKIDRGHIVRREDNAWGKTPSEQEFANSDTFHWTNCTPQHEAFNRSEPGARYGAEKGLWGDFENHVQAALQDVDHRACILAGPVLDPNDPAADFGNGDVQYPLLFWKIVCVTVSPARSKHQLRVFGFLLSQEPVTDRFGIERFGPGKFARYQARLDDIEQAAGLVFDPALHAADTMRSAAVPRRLLRPGDGIEGLHPSP